MLIRSAFESGSGRALLSLQKKTVAVFYCPTINLLDELTAGFIIKPVLHDTALYCMVAGCARGSRNLKRPIEVEKRAGSPYVAKEAQNSSSSVSDFSMMPRPVSSSNLPFIRSSRSLRDWHSMQTRVNGRTLSRFSAIGSPHSSQVP